MNAPDNVIISGSSITDDCAWPTWATWVSRCYEFNNLVKIGIRGTGNEVILTKAIDAAQAATGSVFIIVQLTSVDKWDWYVQDHQQMLEIQKEKHPGVKIRPTDLTGYWCTGSHFPRWKEYYYQNYFSLDHFTYKTLQLIQWFTMLCTKNNWGYQIVFDSPVLSVTEQQLNTGILTKDECTDVTLTKNSLCQVIADMTDYTNIYLPGLIGYACLHDLQWHHKQYKSHPGSMVHYLFTKNIICPILDRTFNQVRDINLFEEEARVYQRLFDET